MLIQIAAHLMKLPMEKIRLVTRTTDRTTSLRPGSGKPHHLHGGGPWWTRSTS